MSQEMYSDSNSPQSNNYSSLIEYVPQRPNGFGYFQRLIHLQVILRVSVPSSSAMIVGIALCTTAHPHLHPSSLPSVMNLSCYPIKIWLCVCSYCSWWTYFRSYINFQVSGNSVSISDFFFASHVIHMPLSDFSASDRVIPRCNDSAGSISYTEVILRKLHIALVFF